MAANRDLEGASLLSFGVVIGGRSPQNEMVGEALRPIAQRVVALRKGYPQKGLMINVIFHVPGPIHQPDYEGVHARRLDRKSGELLVHAAVPPTLRFDGVPNYVAEVL